MAVRNRHVLEMKTCFLPGNRGAWNVPHGHWGFWGLLGPVTVAGEGWSAKQEGTFCVSDLARELLGCQEGWGLCLKTLTRQPQVARARSLMTVRKSSST